MYVHCFRLVQDTRIPPPCGHVTLTERVVLRASAVRVRWLLVSFPRSPSSARICFSIRLSEATNTCSQTSHHCEQEQEEQRNHCQSKHHKSRGCQLQGFIIYYYNADVSIVNCNTMWSLTFPHSRQQTSHYKLLLGKYWGEGDGEGLAPSL